MTPGQRVLVLPPGPSVFRGRYGHVVSVHPSGTLLVRLWGARVALPFAAGELVRAG